LKIIAESAFNHNGDLDYLIALSNTAKETGADYFTVQIMDVPSFCVKEYSKYDIYIENSFTFSQWDQLIDHCKTIDLELIPCVLDIKSLDYCIGKGFGLIKIHATDITNKPLLDKIVQSKDLKILLETQCATHFEIEYAVSTLKEKIHCIIHGFSNYPTEVEDLNLNALDYIKTYFPEYSIGLADHSLDIKEIPLMAMAKGCEYLEKHITLSRNNRNFDWQVSLYPNEFAAMVNTIKHYKKALGFFTKHPTKTELGYRNVMYKKVIDNQEDELKRADKGQDYIEYKISTFDLNNVGIALISRLKSKRLPLKVIKPFHDTILIDFLYKRLSLSKRVKKVVLATSYLNEDKELYELGIEKGFNCFKGHPESVIDRMLSLAFREGFGAIFRVTGDNPFTDPVLIDEMVELMTINDLDYVRVNNVPFGVSGELFSTRYLWKLYLEMDNPMNSEYLTLFVLNDTNARKGCIDIDVKIKDFRFINLSIDYEEDLKRAYALLKLIPGDPYTFKLQDILSQLDELNREKQDKIIKLPEGEQIKFVDFLDKLANQNYTVRKKITY
tara:strand:+ start:62929 stop:64596 length:1668 start_codon:yes stop_codon:yes gene_type:complete